MSRTNDPLPWSLFSTGGVVAALLMPVTILLTGLAVPAGWVSEQSLFDLVHHPLARIFLFLTISLPLFHAAHRLRMVLADTGLRPMEGLVSALLYGIAVVGTVLAVVFLVQL
jgi:fumarate reductase subunit D